MSLSQNIKRFRRAKGLSQEYIAESLCMNQSTYSRLENCEAACHGQLIRLAKALDTTPEVLLTYHCNADTDLPITTAPTGTVPQLETMVLQKDQIIKWQDEEITFLRQQITYLQAVWHQHCGGGVNNQVTVSLDERCLFINQPF